MRKRSAVSKGQGSFFAKEVDLLEGLNPEQVEVVNHDAGPCRVLALAGSGKTESLGRRIARLVRGGTDPRRVLAVTFSKKGADEMNVRISKKLGVDGARVGTWHSLCLQIIREDRLPQAEWAIQDSRPGTSPKMILKDVLGHRGMEWKGADLARITSIIARCKANLYEPASPEALALAREILPLDAQKACRAFHLYNEAIAEKGILTFDDYLVIVAAHLADENARASWAAKWDHVMQDEAQDANRAQCVIAGLLAKDHRNYMVIGDCYQAIYGFRGSSPEFLAKFDQEWPGARTIVLPRNYRCGRRIIEAANAIVGKAIVDGIDVPTVMVGERDADGLVRILPSVSLDDEANAIVAEILESTEAGDTKLTDHTVLFRTNAQSRALEDVLIACRVPYVVVGGMSFYERKEVRDLLAYLRLSARRGAADDIKRSINTPFRFLGAKFVERVMAAVSVDCAAAASQGVHGDDGEIDWTGIILRVADGERLQGRQRASAREWAEMVRGLQDTIDLASGPDAGEQELESAKPHRLLVDIVRATGYLDYLKKEEGGETTESSAAANVNEMIRVAERFATVAALLDYIDETIKAARKQREDRQAGGNRVLLMSIHRSKGLEWPHVYVVGVNENILPHYYGDPQEERRLAYVAATRARDVLTLSFVRRVAMRDGMRDLQPSRFIADTGLAGQDSGHEVGDNDLPELGPAYHDLLQVIDDGEHAVAALNGELVYAGRSPGTDEEPSSETLECPA